MFINRCCAHTFQLSITDITRGSDHLIKKHFNLEEIEVIKHIRFVIQEASRISEKCRISKIKSLLSKNDHVIPSLPNNTRWEGINEMFLQLLKIKNE